VIGLGVVALLYSVVWTWLTTDVRRTTVLEGCGPAPDLVPEG
jgi:hypothetical protein